MTDPFQIQLLTKNTYVWPAEDTTNLAVGTIARKGLKGHSEYLVLSKLAAMLKYFRGKHQQACPTYIVIASKLAPCYRSYNPPAAGCTLEIISKFNEAKRICPYPATQYVVGYNELQPAYEPDWNMAQPLLEEADIIVRQVNS